MDTNHAYFVHFIDKIFEFEFGLDDMILFIMCVFVKRGVRFRSIRILKNCCQLWITGNSGLFKFLLSYSVIVL